MVLARAEYTISTLFDGENFYRAYADSADGSLRFSETDSNRLYLGTYVGRTKPTNYSQYQWTLVKGADGTPGSDAIVAVLTNESHVIPTDENGLNGNYRGATTEIRILEGATDVTSTFTITAKASSGVTGSLSGSKYTVTSMDEDTGEVTLNAKKGSTIITKVFTITKSKKGIQGTDGSPGDDSILYQLNTDTLVVIKDIDDVYSQESVSLTSVMKVGSEDYKNNPVYFRVYEQKVNPLTVDTFSELSMKDQVDNREYILSLYGKPKLLQYESFVKESHIDYNLGKDIMSIFVEIYEDENFTKILDSQSIAVIAEPKPNYKLEMNSTNGNSFVNGIINTEMYVTLYRGEEDITDSTDDKHFIWTRVSSDTASDTAWNNKYKAGAKRITVTKDDVNVRARFSCNFVK